MNMTNSFSEYFEKQSQQYYNCRDFIIQDPPKAYRQKEPVSFEKIEKCVGFKINQSIKDYFCAYWFEELEGFFKREYFYLLCIMPSDNLSELIKEGFKNGAKHYLKDSRYFVIGKSTTGKVMINNTTGEVTKVNTDEKTSVHLSDSLEDMLMHMECEYSKQ